MTADGKMKCLRALRRSLAVLLLFRRVTDRWRRPKVLAAAPRLEVARYFFVAGEMPSDGYGQMYGPRHPKQKLREDFFVAGEMPIDGDGRRYWPPRPAQKSHEDFLVAG